MFKLVIFVQFAVTTMCYFPAPFTFHLFFIHIKFSFCFYSKFTQLFFLIYLILCLRFLNLTCL